MKGIGIWLAALSLAVPAALAAQTSIERPGAIEHRRAHTAFPERVGDFRRNDTVRYAREGDISAEYSMTRPEGRVILSVYVYPSPRMAGRGQVRDLARAQYCLAEISAVGQIISARFAGSAPAAAQPAPSVEGLSSALTHRLAFAAPNSLDGTPQTTLTQALLYCYVASRWQVKYRITAPAEIDAEEAIAHFIRTGPWPGRPAAPDRIAAFP